MRMGDEEGSHGGAWGIRDAQQGGECGVGSKAERYKVEEMSPRALCFKCFSSQSAGKKCAHAHTRT